MAVHELAVQLITRYGCLHHCVQLLPELGADPLSHDWPGLQPAGAQAGAAVQLQAQHVRLPTTSHNR